MPFGRIIRYTLVCCGLILTVALLVAAVKLLPFALKSGVALRSVGPLAVATLATALEVSLLIGTPMGFAGASALQRDAGEPNSADGSDGWSAWFRTLLKAVVWWGTFAFVLGGLANVRLAAPGRVANNLVEAARNACKSDPKSQDGEIPLLGSRWVCSREGSPRLVGVLHRSKADASYTARGMSVSEDLTYIEFSGFTLATPSAKGRVALRLAVSDAKVRGLLPMTRPLRLGDFGRAGFIAVTACLLGAIAAWCARTTQISGRLAMAIALLIALASWLTLLSYDDLDAVGASRYVLVPLSGVALALFLRAVLRQPRVAGVLSKWSSRRTPLESAQ